MEQQIMSLLGGEAAALLPGMMGVSPAAAESSAAPQAFAEALNTALEGLVAPDAAALALLSQQVAMLAPASTVVPLSTASSTLNLWSVATEATLTGESVGGNSLPVRGSEVPQFSSAAAPRAPGFPNTTLPQNTLMPGDPSLAMTASEKLWLNEAVTSSSPLTSMMAPTSTFPSPLTTTPLAASATESDPSLLKVDSFDRLANTSDADVHRDGNSAGGSSSDERSTRSEQKAAAMNSLAALFNVISPANADEAGANHDSNMAATLPSIARAVASVSINPDGNAAMSGGISTPLTGNVAPKAEFSIPQAPQQPGWGDAFVERVSFMVKQNLQEAEIRLNPPQLGQIDVRISFSNDQASLIFSSPHAAVRDAIETSMGRLRELLGESGINLANVDVSDKSLSQHQQNAEAERDANRPQLWNGYRAEFALDEHAGEILGASGSGRIDYYV